MTFRWIAAALGAVLVIAACGGSGVAADKLIPIVQRDGIAFEVDAVPAEVLDRLAGYRVVIVGETHLIHEQQELTASLVEGLYDRGFRQLLLEWPYAAEWVLSDFAIDGDIHPSWWRPPTNLLGNLITAVRDFNRTLPEGARIEVHAIDVDLDNYGGAGVFFESLQGLAGRLPSLGPLTEFFGSEYPTADDQGAMIGALHADLSAERTNLVTAWGENGYDAVASMVQVEMASVPIRETRDRDEGRSARLREEEMKRLADTFLAGYPHGTVIEVGGNHAQKERLKGTNHEWLGDYLVHQSTAAAGSVISLAVAPARIVADFDTDIPDFDIADASPDNELFLVATQTWPDRAVFLPFSDPLFADEAVAMNFEGTIYVAPPLDHYDAMILISLAHRISLP